MVERDLLDVLKDPTSRPPSRDELFRFVLAADFKGTTNAHLRPYKLERAALASAIEGGR